MRSVNRFVSAPPRRRTFIAIDLLAAIGLTVTLAVIFAAALRQFAQVHEDADARRVLRLAVESELNRRRAGITTDALSNTAAPGVELECSTVPATGTWEGFELVHVTARKRVLGGHWVGVELKGYVRRRDTAASDLAAEDGQP